MLQNLTDPANGRVYLVGAGPGDAGLITVRGLNLLRCAGAVVYDALVNPALLDEMPPGAERIFVGKRAGRHSMRQEEINDLLRSLARKHDVVVRLKGGDPFVFGRGGEEMTFLREAGVAVEVVPGVTSAVAAAAAANVPVTHRSLSSSFAVVTGHNATDATRGPDWGALARMDTVVILMGLENARQVQSSLIDAGRNPQTPALIICAATLPTQQSVVTTLGRLSEAAATLHDAAPATIVVGEVVSLAQPTDCWMPTWSAPSASPLIAARSARHRMRGRRSLRTRAQSTPYSPILDTAMID